MNDPATKLKILLLGQTGHGKTAFLNLMANFPAVMRHGVAAAWGKMRPYNDVKLEHKLEDSMVSKTSGATTYEVKFPGMLLSIIDTPGFGDTRGMHVDRENAKKIVDCIKGEEYLHAICLVISGREAKMSTQLSYVLTQICAILPQEAKNNIILVFTNTSNPCYLNFDIKLLSNMVEKHLVHQIFIENPYVQVERVRRHAGVVDDDKIQQGLSGAFMDTGEELDRFRRMLGKMSRLNTTEFEILYKLRQSIENSTVETLSKYREVQQEGKNLGKDKAELEAARSIEELSSMWQQELKQKKWVFKDADRHGTFCGAPDCHSNCHAPCKMPKFFDNERFKRCSAFFYTRQEVAVQSGKDVEELLKHMKDTRLTFLADEDGGDDTFEATVLSADKPFGFKGCGFIAGARIKSLKARRPGWMSKSDLKGLQLPATVNIVDESDQNTCSKCGHGRSLHYHDNKIWVQEEHMQIFIDEDSKDKYEAAKDLRKKKAAALRAYEKRIKECEVEQEELASALLENIRKYEQRGLGRNYALLLQSQRDLLQEHVQAAVEGPGGDDLKDLKQTLALIEEQLETAQAALGKDGQKDVLQSARAMLNVTDAACLGEMEKRYKPEALRLHPDRHGGNPERRQQVNEAHEVLREFYKPRSWFYHPFFKASR